MRYKIIIAPILVFLFLMLTPVKASAQTPVFPQIGQTWTYSITGNANYDTPIDATISYAGTATYTVTLVEPDTFTVQQIVAGTVTWPDMTGTGDVVYVNLEGGGWVETVSTTNTSYSFATSAKVSLSDSEATGLGGDEYSVVQLNYTHSADTITAYVGLTGIFIIIMYPIPTFLTSDSHTYIYWNSSLNPYYLTEDPTAFTEETLTTALGNRIALKNESAFSGVWGPDPVSMSFTWWFDKESSILLKLTNDASVTSSTYPDWTSEVTIELTSCDFFGILGFLMYTKIFGIPLLYLIIGIVILLIILILGVIACRKRK
ncbi:MAG: hypothetical protein ACFFDP_09950 [Promethearchaeota archaeon]